MRRSVNLTESPLDSADTSFDRSEDISTRFLPSLPSYFHTFPQERDKVLQ